MSLAGAHLPDGNKVKNDLPTDTGEDEEEEEEEEEEKRGKKRIFAFCFTPLRPHTPKLITVASSVRGVNVSKPLILHMD
jgi:hypothetical protein